MGLVGLADGWCAPGRVLPLSRSIDCASVAHESSREPCMHRESAGVDNSDSSLGVREEVIPVLAVIGSCSLSGDINRGVIACSVSGATRAVGVDGPRNKTSASVS